MSRNDDQEYYQILGLESGFDMDEDALIPYALAAAEERAVDVKQDDKIVEALYVLSDPVRRDLYNLYGASFMKKLQA